MKTTSRIKLDIYNAVELATAKIHSGFMAFFVDTEFGVIPVEVNRSKFTMYSSYTKLWRNCHTTKWVASNRSGNYKWYVSIDYFHGQDEIITKMQLAREFSRIIYAEFSGGTLPGDDISTALMNVYMQSYGDMKSSFDQIEKFCKAYIQLHAGVKSKFIISPRNLAMREIIRLLEMENKITKRIVDDIEMQLDNVSLGEYMFGSEFYAAMMALTMVDFGKDYKGYLRVYNKISTGDGCITSLDLIRLLQDPDIYPELRMIGNGKEGK